MGMLSNGGSERAAEEIDEFVMKLLQEMKDGGYGKKYIDTAEGICILERIHDKCRSIITSCESGWY